MPCGVVPPTKEAGDALRVGSLRPGEVIKCFGGHRTHCIITTTIINTTTVQYGTINITVLYYGMILYCANLFTTFIPFFLGMCIAQVGTPDSCATVRFAIIVQIGACVWGVTKRLVIY